MPILWRSRDWTPRFGEDLMHGPDDGLQNGFGPVADVRPGAELSKDAAVMPGRQHLP